MSNHYSEKQADRIRAAMVKAGQLLPFFHGPSGEVRYFQPEQVESLNMAEYTQLPTTDRTN